MTETESEMTRLFIEAIAGKRDRYHILFEVNWLIENSRDLTEEQRNYYRNEFGRSRLPSVTDYGPLQ